MPLIGLGLGNTLARGIGTVAGYLPAAVIGIGGWILLSGRDEEAGAAGRIAATRGLATIALRVSISLDELAIGFSIGLVRLPLVAALVAIGVQALIADQLLH